MEAFERISSGIPEMDRAFDSIRLGDNVVFQVGSLEEFRLFAEPFVRQAAADGRKLIYVRFASHPPLLTPRPGLCVRAVELSHRFETFTMAIHSLVEEAGRGAFYVFDCLSELQTAWSTDLMMGNFFRVICPFLFRLDTVAYFPILRGCHSYPAVAKIRDTTQVLLDVFRDGTEDAAVYVHPLKIWKRYAPTMFLPHRFVPAEGTFRPLTDGVAASRFYTVLGARETGSAARNLDNWDRIFLNVQEKLRDRGASQADLQMLCRIMMTRDEKLRALVDGCFTAEDYLAVRARMVGTGLIGGKACGMLLARKLAERALGPEDAAHFEPHDSFYIGSDVFYTYIVENNCWELRVRQRTREGYLTEAPALARALMAGVFPDDLREAFRRLLDYYGQSPIIVRSSSILEDGFGNAFAGKYASVFCANVGDPEERLAAFEAAVRTVYASTMDPSALEYRARRGLWQRDEQMALLVQRVSGSYYGSYFLPDAAGVGYSFSMYRLRPDMDPRAGMLRLVMGLGTHAVDRSQGDYPRLVGLDAPTAAPPATPAERHRYSQQGVDVIALPRGEAQTSLEALLPVLPPPVIRALTDRDADAERIFSDRGESRQVRYISCGGLLENAAFTGLMARLLRALQTAYDHPVDIEFTVNLGADGGFVMNLLQCRPLQVRLPEGGVRIPAPRRADTLLHLRGASMGRSLSRGLDWAVLVDPRGYTDCPYARKAEAAGIIGRVNRFLKDRDDLAVLFAPGRIGTSSPELGVPVRFADISQFGMLCEIAWRGGYRPELSYGSHMFQDLVENDILYGAVFEDEKTLCWQPELLAAAPDRFGELCPDDGGFAGIVHVYDLRGAGFLLLHDAAGQEVLIAKGPDAPHDGETA